MQVRSSLSVLLVLAVLVLASPAFLSDGRAPIGEARVRWRAAGKPMSVLRILLRDLLI